MFLLGRFQTLNVRASEFVACRGDFNELNEVTWGDREECVFVVMRV